jgi:hypothetical protein
MRVYRLAALAVGAGLAVGEASICSYLLCSRFVQIRRSTVGWGSPPHSRRIDWSALPDDALDHADGDPIDPGDLGDRQPVIHPGSNARVVRPRDLARGPGLGVDRWRGFLVADGAGDRIASTRGFRAGRSAEGAGSESDGSTGCRFGVKSASAAWRALVIRSRSSPRGWCCCSRWLSKGRPDCLATRNIEGEFVNFGKLLPQMLDALRPGSSPLAKAEASAVMFAYFALTGTSCRPTLPLFIALAENSCCTASGASFQDFGSLFVSARRR